MRTLTRSIRTVLTLMVAAILLASTGPAALAKDVVKLKDGTVLEGEIAREVNGTIFLTIRVGDLSHDRIIPADDIESVERDLEDPDAEPAVEPKYVPDGAAKIAFITLEEQVGPFFNKNAIEHSVELLNDLPEEEQPGIIVFWIDSGGGALAELVQIVPYIEDEVKPKYRTVAWIRSAISAAAMTAWVMEEIYMMKEGNIGACTAFSTPGGKTQAMEGQGLEQLLAWMEQVSAWGRKDPYVMRAMQVYMTLSCNIDEDDNITWFDDDSGTHLVSPQDRILTFHAHDAVKFKVAEAVVDTKEELARALGYEEWVEVGEEADRYQQEFRENVGRAQVKLGELWVKLNLAVEAASGAPSEDERTRQIGVARRYLREMKGWVNRAPSLSFYSQFNDEFFREIDRQLRDLARR